MAEKFRAGLLRYQVTIQEPSVAIGTDGGATTTWSTFATVWADVVPLKGREYFQAATANTEVDAMIRTRYITGVTADMRIVHGSTVYDIQSPPINVDGRNRELQMMCKTYGG